MLIALAAAILAIPTIISVCAVVAAAEWDRICAIRDREQGESQRFAKFDGAIQSHVERT